MILFVFGFPIRELFYQVYLYTVNRYITNPTEAH